MAQVAQAMTAHELRIDGSQGPVGVTQVLLEASQRGQLAGVQAALEQEGRRRERERVPRSPLHEAAAEGFAELVGLFGTGCPGWRDGPDGPLGMTPLMHAAARGHVEAVTALLEMGAEVGVRDRKGRTALAHAIRKGHEGVKRALAAATESHKVKAHSTRGHR